MSESLNEQATVAECVPERILDGGEGCCPVSGSAGALAVTR